MQEAGREKERIARRSSDYEKIDSVNLPCIRTTKVTDATFLLTWRQRPLQNVTLVPQDIGRQVHAETHGEDARNLLVGQRGLGLEAAEVFDLLIGPIVPVLRRLVDFLRLLGNLGLRGLRHCECTDLMIVWKRC